jgi:hypothetical protein
MLKKLATTLGGVLFAFTILAVSFLNSHLAVTRSYAMATLKFSVSPSEGIETGENKIDYNLPEVKILPDNIFYKIVMLGDQLKILSSSGYIKRGNLFTNLSDKRLFAGRAMIDKGKVPLGITTLEKGEKYLERAVNEIVKSENNQEIQKIKTSCLKHEEVLFELSQKVNPDGKTAIVDLLKFNKILLGRIESLSL